MADLVTVAQTDSTNDGSGASTILEPPQVDNATDDAILIKVTQSLNNATNVSNINVTTPTSYTLLTDLRDAELRSWVYYKRSTGSETIPTVTSDTSASWTCTTVVVTDVDWANGGVVQHVQNTGSGDQQSPDLTTNASGSASAILCFFSLERRLVQGFRYPETRPQTLYKGTVSTGTGEGIDNAAGFGFDFMTDRSTNFDAPFWEASGGSDSLAINVEVLVQGNVIPLQASDYVIQNAPNNNLQTTMNWCREICDSGKHIDGSTLQTWSFAPSDVDTATNQITITGHGMDESMVVRLSDGGGTAPGGLADDTFYYVEPISANAIQLRSVNEDSDATSDYYAEGTTKRSVVGITSTGTGTFTFTEARMINAAQFVLDILRPPDGSVSNVGSFSGNYVGDAGYNQNDVGTSQRFNSVLDLTGETLTFQLQVNAASRLSRVSTTLIDEDGDWMTWQIWKEGVSLNITGQQIYQFQADQASVQALAAQSFGTFDVTRVRYLVVTTRGNNLSPNRFGAVNSLTSRVQLGGPLTIINGQNASLTDLVSLAETYTTTITKPSDLQVVSLIPLGFGDGTNNVSFTDSEKSIAFPPLADGATSFQNYLDNLGLTINANATSTVKLTDSQIGASVPFGLTVTAATGATIDLTGNSYVSPTASLDADATYTRQLYVGGTGVTHNGAEIRNSTFIVNSQLGADKGIVDLDSNTDIESSAFELSSGTTTGHGIKIIAAGSYTFNALTFNNFGADGSSTAAVYNDSGGAVTITNSGGTAPTVRNGTGASTIVQDPPQPISITNISAGSRLQIYNITTSTETVNQIVSGTSYTSSYTEGVEYTDGDTVRIRLTKLGKDEWTGNVIDTSSGFSVLAEQVDSSVYAAMGVDGSTVIKFAADYVQSDVNLIIGTDWTMAELYAWWMYNLTTEQGIREFFGGITAIDQSNFRVNTATANIYLDNTTNASYKQTDNRRFFRDTGDGYPIKSPTTSGYGLDAVWRNTILIAETATSGLTPAESAKLDVISDVNNNTKLIPALL